MSHRSQLEAGLQAATQTPLGYLCRCRSPARSTSGENRDRAWYPSYNPSHILTTLTLYAGKGLELAAE